VPQAPGYFTGSEVRLRDPDQAKLHVAIAFRGASWVDADSVPLMVAQSMLGSWSKGSGAGGESGSALAQTVAANNLADSFMAFNTNYHDTGERGAPLVGWLTGRGWVF
jgi:processing peptidase subunit beta